MYGVYKVTREEKDRAVDAVLRGVRLREVAANHDVSVRTVRRWVEAQAGRDALKDADIPSDDMLRDFPAWLRAEMAARGMGCADLADAIGVGAATVQAWLGGAHSPRIATLVEILDVLGGDAE